MKIFTFVGGRRNQQLPDAIRHGKIMLFCATAAKDVAAVCWCKTEDMPSALHEAEKAMAEQKAELSAATGIVFRDRNEANLFIAAAAQIGKFKTMTVLELV